jgi:hypothetical protein
MDRTARGSSADYCSVDTFDGHHMVSHMGGIGRVRSVDRCSLCGWIDFEDINRQASKEAVPAPICPECSLSMGWTRYIRCMFFNKPIVCEGCSFKVRQRSGR